MLVGLVAPPPRHCTTVVVVGWLIDRYWKATGSPELLSLENFRLEAGLEYTAKYNLGGSVPFEPNCDVYNISCFQNISDLDRGSFANLWEMAAVRGGGEESRRERTALAGAHAFEAAPIPLFCRSPTQFVSLFVVVAVARCFCVAAHTQAAYPNATYVNQVRERVRCVRRLSGSRQCLLCCGARCGGCHCMQEP